MGILNGVTKTAERIGRNAQHVVQGTVNAVSKGTGAVIGGTLGLNKRMLYSSGGAIKEAMSEFRAGARAAYGKTSGKTARLAKESAEASAKATKEATEKVGMQTRRLNQANNVMDPNFMGPHTASAVDDARKINMVNNANNKDFIGPMPAEAEVRSASRDIQANMTPDFIGPMPAPDMNTASGIMGTVKEVWDGIPGWAKTAGAVTAGGIAGAVLFDEDDDYDE